MAKIKRDPKRREAIQKFIELYQPESVEDIYESLKDMLGETIEQMLETELENQIGYPKGDKPNSASNSRNGYSSKVLRSKAGAVPINVPRDRYGELNRRLLRSIKLIFLTLKNK